MAFMTEEEGRIDEIIRSAASDYNRPPAVPRDEMWNAIQAARQSAPTGPRLHVTAGGASRSVPIGGHSATRRSAPRYAWLAMAAAAVLLVATGVGIGRWTSKTAPPAAQPERQVADRPADLAPTITGDSVQASLPPAEASSAVASPSVASSKPSRIAPQIVGTRPLTRLVAENGSDGRTQAQLSAVTYQVATQQHLQDAEALLTSFSLESRDERMNAQFAGWAKGLLSNTRLLLDSPAGDDPRRAKLLQDLELVLAQIVQLSPNAAAQERELIQGSIQDAHVMTRLRTAIPAAQPIEIMER